MRTSTRTVTVGQLREALEQYDDEIEIRIVHQESYPLQEVIGGLWEADPTRCEECGVSKLRHNDHNENACDEFSSPADGDERIVYLVANGHPSHGSPYGSKEAWNGLAL